MNEQIVSKIPKKERTIWLFKIPNNLYGRMVMWIIKRHMNKQTYRLFRRGRHTNRKKLKQTVALNFDNDVPVKHAEYYAVYLRPKNDFTHYIQIYDRFATKHY